MITAILSAIIATTFTYFWRESANETYLQSAIDDVILAYQDEIDALKNQVDSYQQAQYNRLQTRPGDKGSQDSLIKVMTDEIKFLRKQLPDIMKETIRTMGVDSVDVYIKKLGDSLFVSHYGDYVKTVTWRIAAEELGAIGKRSVPHLIGLLDTENDYELSQVLYALMLASQHNDILSFTKDDNPSNRRRIEYRDMPKSDAWKKWFEKYKHEWE